MELRQVRAVHAVAATRHFGRAAASLGVTPSTLSHTVSELEKELGVALFTRTTRSVTVTDAGRAFVEQTRPGLSLLDAAASRAAASGRGEAGSLAIGLLGSALDPPLPRVLREFRARRPGVSITVHELTTAEQVDGLLGGRLDVGFVRPPLPAPADRLLATTTISRTRLVAVLPSRHRLARMSTLPMRSLAGEPFVRTPRARGAGFHDQVTSLCRRAGFEPHTVQEATRISSVVGLVAAGFGVSVVPERRTAVPGVVFVPLSARDAVVDLALAVPTDRPRSPQTDVFVSLVRAAAHPPRRSRKD